MTTAIFLGAGASAAEGAPLQSNLFRDYFKSVQGKDEFDPSSLIPRRLYPFFLEMFGIDIQNDSLDDVLFPTFEEVLGILDLAEIRNESFISYKIPNNVIEFYMDIRVIRSYLTKLMGIVIRDKLLHSMHIHRKLVSKLVSVGAMENSIFISTNYDILIDNALIDQAGIFGIDYGIDFANGQSLDISQRPQRTGIKLFKLHGSLNWLYCSTCNNLKLTPFEKSSIEDFLQCEECGTLYGPVIIPPTYFKNISNTFINQVWNNAENTCRNVDKIVFCGYSFPDADIHVKYLLKRIETNRRSSLHPLNVNVFNYHKRKTRAEKTAEQNRFQRFFKSNISYLDVSFQDFAENPMNYLQM
jgi:hypothetical protein